MQRRRTSQPFNEREYREVGQRVSSVVQSAISAIPPVRTKVVMPADVTISNATYANLTGLSFAVVAGTVYHFEIRILFTGSSTSAGSGWAITGPATPTSVAYITTFTGSSLVQEYAVAYDGIAASLGAASTAGNFAIINGLIVPSTSGTVTARGRGESGFTVTAKAGSVLEWWEGA